MSKKQITKQLPIQGIPILKKVCLSYLRSFNKPDVIANPTKLDLSL